MLKTIGAIVIGLLSGMAFNMTMVSVTGVLYPVPECIDPEVPEEFAVYMQSLPTMAYLLVLVAHLGQAGIGAFIAALLSKQSAMLVAMSVGVLSLIGGIINMMLMPLPAWMWFEMPMYLAVAYLAGRWVRGRISKTVVEQSQG